MIRIGMLQVSNDQLFFLPLDNQPHHVLIHIAPGTAFEIRLGGVWIPGELRVSNDPDEATELHFMTKQGDFCGVIAGMAARLFFERDSQNCRASQH